VPDPLTVRGRKSGQPHTVPVLLVEQDGHSFLVAPYGVIQWVHNIRAAGTATLTRGHRFEAISVTGLEAMEAARPFTHSGVNRQSSRMPLAASDTGWLSKQWPEKR